MIGYSVAFGGLFGLVLLALGGAIPLAIVALDAGWGIVGVWAALSALIVMRFATCGMRFAGRHWVTSGAG